MKRTGLISFRLWLDPLTWVLWPVYFGDVSVTNIQILFLRLRIDWSWD